MKKMLLSFLGLVLAFPAMAATPVNSIEPGDLIRGQSFSAVYYYGEDGMRYVFPNDKTYFTWYDNFDNIKWLTDADLASIQIGGNVTYKPGVKMLKINSDPKVYAVSAGGTLRAVGSEAIAIALYGTDWNTQIDDIPDGFFGNYELGSDIELATQYDRDAEVTDAMSINDDKGLSPYVSVSVTDDGYDKPTITVPSGTAVRWTNTGAEKHSVTEWDSLWGSGTLKPGEHFTRYFWDTGTWHYYSKYDAKTSVGGAVIVE